MLDSKEDKLKVIRSLMQNNKVLHQRFFDENQNLLPWVHKHLCMVVEFIKINYLSCLQNVEIDDVVLTGSLCGHTYNNTSDLDLFIILKDECTNGFVLDDNIISALSNFLIWSLKPKNYGHLIDVGLMKKSGHIKERGFAAYSTYATYSILKNNWYEKSLYSEFDVTPEEMLERYQEYSDGLHQFVQQLPKTDDGFLTYDGVQELDGKISELKKNAFNAKHDNPKHEYELDYLLYRLAKKFGLLNHYGDYVFDSYKHYLGNDKRITSAKLTIDEYVKALLTPKETLSEELFIDGVLKEDIKKQIKDQVDFVINKTRLNQIDGLSIKDVYISGDFAGYYYNDLSSIDIKIEVSNENCPFLASGDEALEMFCKEIYWGKLNDYKFTLNNRKITFTFCAKKTEFLDLYSINQDKWLKEPDKQERQHIDVENLLSEWNKRYNNLKTQIKVLNENKAFG